MHVCTTYRVFEGYTEERTEFSWSLALHIDIRIGSRGIEEVSICQHETYRLLENPQALIDEILKEGSRDSILLVLKLVEILDRSIGEEWRRDFEIVIRRDEVQISSYM